MYEQSGRSMTNVVSSIQEQSKANSLITAIKKGILCEPNFWYLTSALNKYYYIPRRARAHEERSECDRRYFKVRSAKPQIELSTSAERAEESTAVTISDRNTYVLLSKFPPALLQQAQFSFYDSHKPYKPCIYTMLSVCNKIQTKGVVRKAGCTSCTARCTSRDVIVNAACHVVSVEISVASSGRSPHLMSLCISQFSHLRICFPHRPVGWEILGQSTPSCLMCTLQTDHLDSYVIPFVLCLLTLGSLSEARSLVYVVYLLIRART